MCRLEKSSPLASLMMSEPKKDPKKAKAFTPGDWESMGCLVAIAWLAVRVACVAVVLWLAVGQSASAVGPLRRAGHNALVAQSGISPRQVGSYEGVGMSTRGYEAAKQNACYWGQRTPVSIQYSKRGDKYYAVVRYR